MTVDPQAEQQLASFLGKYSPEIAARAEAALMQMRRRYPTATEMVYDNYNALAIGIGPGDKTSEAIFSIAVYPRWVSLFFLQAKGLKDPAKLLKGSRTVAKHIVLQEPGALDTPEMRELMAEAVARAKAPFNPAGKRRLVIKSVSAKQRPRRP